MDGNGEKVETTNQLQWTMNVVDETRLWQVSQLADSVSGLVEENT